MEFISYRGDRQQTGYYECDKNEEGKVQGIREGMHFRSRDIFLKKVTLLLSPERHVESWYEGMKGEGKKKRNEGSHWDVLAQFPSDDSYRRESKQE